MPTRVMGVFNTFEAFGTRRFTLGARTDSMLDMGVFHVLWAKVCGGPGSGGPAGIVMFPAGRKVEWSLTRVVKL
jgi:hypothetical protein